MTRIFDCYRHTKTGNIYVAIAMAINKTNNQDDTMVVYHPDDNENSILVMEEKEFFETFDLHQID